MRMGTMICVTYVNRNRTMKYNFDEIIERRGTNSVKWDGVKISGDVMIYSLCG